MNRWEQFDAIVGRLEKAAVVVLLSLMILVAVFQIVLRNFFATGFDWGDPLVRYLVLWVGFIGAAIATREDKHIVMEVLPRWARGKKRTGLHVVSHLFSTLICGLLTFAALKFIHMEARMGSAGFLGIPAWVLELILPITFGLMTLRFAFRFIKALAGITHSGTTPRQEQKT